jgi:uncharacterized membrane protein YfcA
MPSPPTPVVANGGVTVGGLPVGYVGGVFGVGVGIGVAVTMIRRRRVPKVKIV